MSRHSAAFLISCLCIVASLLVASNFKSAVITDTSPTLTIVVPDHHFLQIRNFTQERGTQRRGVIALTCLAVSIGAVPMSVVAPSQLAAGQTDTAAETPIVLQSQQDAWNRGHIATFMNGYSRSDDTVVAARVEVTAGWHRRLDR